ncbi:MAG TPA: hypothetical protein PKH40_09485 [Treponemataceae bacterium]|nr:hypothetical protein [Treponemataceae bacterium]
MSGFTVPMTYDSKSTAVWSIRSGSAFAFDLTESARWYALQPMSSSSRLEELLMPTMMMGSISPAAMSSFATLSIFQPPYAQAELSQSCCPSCMYRTGYRFSGFAAYSGGR